MFDTSMVIIFTSIFLIYIKNNLKLNNLGLTGNQKARDNWADQRKGG
jgi:hypothetical protein